MENTQLNTNLLLFAALLQYHISAVQCDYITRMWMLEAFWILPDDEKADPTATYQSQSIVFQDNHNTARLPWSFLNKSQVLQLYSKIIRDQLAADFIEKVP